ncbi:hypothetical protein NY78_2668 [Desulfovibrio sp. TomC]|nr:hypothetical protein NY78_2668 [Desulfovibrio sp. TomC]
MPRHERLPPRPGQDRESFRRQGQNPCNALVLQIFLVTKQHLPLLFLRNTHRCGKAYFRLQKPVQAPSDRAGGFDVVCGAIR